MGQRGQPRGRDGQAPRRRRVHHHGRAGPRPRPQGRQSHPRPRQHRPDVAPGARARRPDPGFPADRRGVRLGRSGLQGTDRDDPRHPVRLSLRETAQAAVVVGHDDEHARPRTGGKLEAEGRGDVRVLRRLQRTVERAGQRRAWNRPDFHAGPQPGHPEHGAGGISRQRRAADRGRQRHHPQHHLGQRLCAQQEPRSVRQAARRSVPGALHGLWRPFAIRPRWPR